ncbi:pyroglutamyl-peptidase I family protein [Mangrovibrevibacter kandeliae]|uniref:pyroglutamyl-peptidase I family protein n=1 Tax=Mangrovibrevibacter kandeliae TaxID=2968473 RepID=UPI00211850E7|nr:hypothetical protein [Aurantimonas sp. CSK15Z-1]MCQ8781040.1 hypothetical protein [Aurantimonas sp. CSK15Z-1]
MTILVTGFSAFPGAPINPTADLAASFDGGSTAGGEAVRGVVLPVEWEGSWPRLRAAIEASAPRVVLMFALQAGLTGLRVELTARNRRELGRPDAVGAFPSGPAVADGPERFAVRLPLTDAATALRAAREPFDWSGDAGRYLGNDTFYKLAMNADRLAVERFGFLHVPLTDDLVDAWNTAGVLPSPCTTLAADRLRSAARALIEVL